MKKLFPVALLLLVLVSCKKEVDELPSETQTGANTFGAKINGEFWVPRGFGPFPANDILEARKNGSDIIINARNFSSSPTETEFQIYLQNVTSPGVYPLVSDVVYPNMSANYAYYVKRNMTPINEWITSSAHTGQVYISKIDTVNKIISGTFSFNMMNLYNTPEPLSVTEGWFDIRLE